MDIVANDNYTIYITEPEGVKLKEFTCEGVKITENKKYGIVRQITVFSNTSLTINWEAEYFE